MRSEKAEKISESVRKGIFLTLLGASSIIFFNCAGKQNPLGPTGDDGTPGQTPGPTPGITYQTNRSSFDYTLGSTETNTVVNVDVKGSYSLETRVKVDGIDRSDFVPVIGSTNYIVPLLVDAGDSKTEAWDDDDKQLRIVDMKILAQGTDKVYKTYNDAKNSADGSDIQGGFVAYKKNDILAKLNSAYSSLSVPAQTIVSSIINNSDRNIGIDQLNALVAGSDGSQNNIWIQTKKGQVYRISLDSIDGGAIRSQFTRYLPQ